MSFKFNPITGRLDMVNSISGTGKEPQTGAVSPEGVTASRYKGDLYLDSVSGILYTNPNASGNTGREMVQTSPA